VPRRSQLAESYAVRVYRRPRGARLLVGVVERVGVAGCRAFHDADELWTIRAPRRPGRARPRRSGRSVPTGARRRR
jgi:hypothetical protein